MGKKNKKASFAKMLEENMKKVTVNFKGEVRTVADLTEQSAEHISASPVDALIPVSAAEAAENTIAGESALTLISSYSQTVFSMYEYALKNQDVKQTLLLQFTADEMEEVFDDGFDSRLDMLYSRTNLRAVIENIPSKVAKRMLKWSEEESDNPNMYVVRIPDLLFFHGSIKKGEPSKANPFDLVLTFVRTDKSINKMKKKHPAAFDEFTKWMVNSTVSVIKELGVSCVHMTLCPEYFDDPHDYASTWVQSFKNSPNKILNRCVFCTSDPDILISFQNQLVNDLINVAEIKAV